MIGLFGGSFDPPHLGHLGIIRSFWKQFPEAKTLYLVPNRLSPFKEKKNVEKKDLLRMLEILVKEEQEDIRISNLELERETEKSYTIDTLKRFEKELPGEELQFLLGSDSLERFMDWKDSDEILRLAGLLVFQRPGFSAGIPDGMDEKKVLFLRNEPLPYSSSAIRKELGSGGRPEGLSEGVYSYIKQRELYI